MRREQEKFVKEIITPHILDKRVVNAFLEVPRDEFVPAKLRKAAYLDEALPIGENQTISQPSLVAQMVDELGLTGKEKVLDVGTGSGYQAAILAKLAKEVHSIETQESLFRKATKLLKRLGFENVKTYLGDGSLGLPEEALFDAIIVAAGTSKIPQALVDQLKEGGRIVIPIGETDAWQNLVKGVKEKGELEITNLGGVKFVPLKTKLQKTLN